MRAVFLKAEWRRLLMLNYSVEPKYLANYVPRGTELDTWGGVAYVSLVAFQFLKTKVRGITVPFHRNFEEINLRLYVRSRGPEGWRRGVVFVREVVPRLAIASVARWLYNENYVSCPTRATVMDPTDECEGRVEYGWKHRGGWITVSAKTSGSPEYPAAESQEEFITEHYWGYSSQRDGGTIEYRVEHPQWRVWAATDSTVEGDVVSFYGPHFPSVLSEAPTSAFVAEGSPIKVRMGDRIDARVAV